MSSLSDYARSCNPSRRAKRLRVDPQSDASSPADQPSDPAVTLPLLPKRPNNPATALGHGIPDNSVAADIPVVAVPVKRGRKPGPLSRSAREAQRKLNHSIIEKARRTKINDALATLRQLVPADYGNSRDAEDTDEDMQDDEYEEGTKKAKGKTNGISKKKEKEKEFKLEILIRTVAFLQDLLVKVGSPESEGALGCANCAGTASSKRKRGQDDQEDHDLIGRRKDECAVKATAASMQPEMQSPLLHALRFGAEIRLPSISSWLPSSQVDLHLNAAGKTHSSSYNGTSYLPSPPSSARFDPVGLSQVPPALNLGPVASSAMLSPIRTPEDESAASLLLQISGSSPLLLPISSASLNSQPAGRFTGAKNSKFVQPQTPSSLLGLSQDK